VRRLKPFLYFEPTTLSKVFEILAEKGERASLLAGGTDLLVRMKKGEITPPALVNLKRIRGLDQIATEPGENLRIGALAPIAAVENSPLVNSSHPILAQAAGLLGTPSIKNLATLGGNVGRASPASDTVPPLIVLGARVAIEGPQGKRELDLEDLFSGPGTTTLAPGEVITSFFLPKMTSYSVATYEKLGRRAGVDIALVGVAVLLTLDVRGYEVKDARVALAAVAPVPLRAKRAEEVLLSGSLTEERMKEAARVAAEDSSPITDMRASASYRKEMVKTLTVRALGKAMELAQGGKTKG
jgi:carbon-monoxide dehydrogenase medium subunit